MSESSALNCTVPLCRSSLVLFSQSWETHQIRWVVDRLNVWYFLSNADDRLTIDGECTAWNKWDRRCIWSEKKNGKLFSISKFLDVWILQEVRHLVRLVTKNHIVKLKGTCPRDVQGVFFTSHVQLTQSTILWGWRKSSKLPEEVTISYHFHYRDSREEFQPFYPEDLAYKGICMLSVTRKLHNM